MLSGLRNIAEAGIGWVEAESSVLLGRAERVAARGALLVGACVAGALALCGLLVGVGLLLAPYMGAGATALLMSGVVLLGAGLVGWRAARGLRDVRASARAEAEAIGARERLKDALPGSDASDGAEEKEGVAGGGDALGMLGDVGGAILKSVSDPGVVTGSVFALVSVLGVGRTLRIARTAASLMGSAAIIADALQSEGVGARSSRTGRAASAGGVSTNGHSRGRGVKA